MLAEAFVTVRQADLQTAFVFVAVATLALVAVALYDRWPRWR